jgi:DNA replication initiation complex subunit (GINS family)
MLTYDTLSRTLNQERVAKTLTELPEEFFEDAKLYIETKSRVGAAKDDSWELENAKRLLQDLMEIRERKILTLALYFVRSGASPNNLTLEERDFFNVLVSALKDFQSRKKVMLDGKPENRWMLGMLSDVPEFMDLRLRKNGPFRKGDIATVSEEHAKLLVEKGLAKKLDV